MAHVIIVVPCYNEAARLDVDTFRQYAVAETGCEFVFVNDGSTDGTLGILESLRAENPRQFQVWNIPVNSGKAEAVRQGVLQALANSPDLIGYWDSDLSTPLESISDLTDLLDHDPEVLIVLGARVRLLGKHIERYLVRHLLGRVFATTASLVLKLPVYDTQCGAKCFRATPEMKSLFVIPFCTGWVFDVELLARFLVQRRAAGLSCNDTIVESPLRRWRDVAGSKVRPWHFLTSFVEMARIYWRYFRLPPQKSPWMMELRLLHQQESPAVTKAGP